MVISLLGSPGVKCQVADFSLVIDPPAKKRGNLTLLSKLNVAGKDLIEEEDVINGAGEYEIGGIKIRGTHLSKESTKSELVTGYSILFDGIRLAALPALSGKMEDNEIDALGEVDILFIDVEHSTLNIKDIASLVKKVDPSIVIATSDKGAKELVEELGQKITSEEKLIIKAKDFNKEASGIQAVWLKE